MFTTVSKWGGIMLSTALMPTEIPLWFKILLGIVALISGIINILNGVNTAVDNAPKWKIYWMGWLPEIRQVWLRFTIFVKIRKESRRNKKNNNNPI